MGAGDLLPQSFLKEGSSMCSENEGSWRKFTDHIKYMAEKIHNKSWGAYSKLVKYTPENIEQIHKSFIENYVSMKSQMMEDTENLERFKIISAYTKAILAHPLFMPDKKAVAKFLLSNAEIPICIKYPNSYFIYIMILSLINDYSAEVKRNMWGIDSYYFSLPVKLYNLKFKNNEYVTEDSDFTYRFIKFICYYSNKESIEKFPLFAFSNILLLLEMSNDCANFDLADKYYEPSQDGPHDKGDI
jgi:hypothetical protein